jgi:two-component system, sensor histidine kinase
MRQASPDIGEKTDILRLAMHSPMPRPDADRTVHTRFERFKRAALWGMDIKLMAWALSLTLVVVASMLFLDEHERRLLAGAGEHEGYAWNVAQYQLALQRVQATLHWVAEETAEREAKVKPGEGLTLLGEQAVVLGSRTHVVADASEYAAFYRRLPQYEGVSQAMRDFIEQLSSAVGEDGEQEGRASAWDRRKMQALLVSVTDLEQSLVPFANEVRAEEVHAAELLRRRIERYRTWLWLAIGAAWGGMLFWLGGLARSESRHRQTAQQLQAVLIGEQAALLAEQATRAELQEEQRARNQFMGMVSHELRSPLQSILSALDLMDARLGDARIGLASGSHSSNTAVPANDAVRPLFERIRRATTSLEAQLRDLLTLAQGEVGQLELRPEPFEARALLEEVVEQWQAQAQAKGLHLVMAASNEPIFVVADPLRISQIVANLVSNAVKYTDQGEVRVGVMLQSEGADEGRIGSGHAASLVLMVQDSGPGIPEALQARIFGAWKRFGAVEGKSHSAGIGLAIVHTVVRHLGGSVRLHSGPGEGSRFVVTVPVVPLESGDSSTLTDDVPPMSAAAAMEPVQTQQAGGPTPRLLIVDDRPDVLEALGSVASELHFDFDMADCASTAANLLAANPYDTVLIDLDMPIKSGQQLASEVRRGTGPNRGARLLAMSAADLNGMGSAWPFDGFVAKPITLQTLAAAVRVASLDSPAPLAARPSSASGAGLHDMHHPARLISVSPSLG